MALPLSPQLQASPSGAGVMDPLRPFSDDANSEYMMLDLRPETVHCWRKLNDCDESVGVKRSKHTLVAYQSRLYVFGGDNGKTMLNDLLRYDIRDNSWSRECTLGSPPAPRYHHTAVVYGNSMFVFGGYTGDLHLNWTNKNDLHEYRFNSCTWMEWRFSSRSKKPVPRAAHGAVVHGDRMWIFAGYDGNVRLNDMWNTSLQSSNLPDQWVDNRDWTEVAQQGDIPPPCCNIGMTVTDNFMYVFSGSQSGAQTTNKVFQFDFETAIWTRISTDHILRSSIHAPDKRYGHTMVAFSRHLYVFGGAGAAVLPNCLYSYDLDTHLWSVVHPTEDSQVPCMRLFHAGTVVGSTLYTYGGALDNSTRFGDLHRIPLANYPKCTLRDDFDNLRKEELFCDLLFQLHCDGETLEGEETEVKAHIAFVAARSPYLRQKIRAAKQAQRFRNGVLLVELDGVDPKAMKLILAYIYSDEIRPAQTDEEPYDNNTMLLMIRVYQLSVRFELRRLEFLFVRYFDTWITEQNVLVAMQTASEMNLNFLKEYCLRFIVKEAHFSNVIMTPEFEHLVKPLMIEIIRRKTNPSSDASHRPAGEGASTPPYPPAIGVSGPYDSGYLDSALEQDMETFLNNGREFCDVVLLVDGHEFPAHKAVLISRSKYFLGMYRSMPPKDNRVKITIGENVPTPDALKSLLRFIYFGDTDMPPQDSLYLFTAPYFYQFTNLRLQAYCKQNLEVNISVQNIFNILDAADKINAVEMKRRAMSLIVSHLPQVAKLPHLRSLSRDLLVEIIQATAGAMQLQDSQRPRLRHDSPVQALIN